LHDYTQAVECKIRGDRLIDVGLDAVAAQHGTTPVVVYIHPLTRRQIAMKIDVRNGTRRLLRLKRATLEDEEDDLPTAHPPRHVLSPNTWRTNCPPASGPPSTGWLAARLR